MCNVCNLCEKSFLMRSLRLAMLVRLLTEPPVGLLAGGVTATPTWQTELSTRGKINVRSFDFNPPDANANDAQGSSQTEGSSNSRPAKRGDFLSLFMHLWPGDWQEQLKNMS
jgi:hypothetical protein